MKSTLKLFGFLLLMVIGVSSCSKDDDPVDNDLFTGKYSGQISYTDNGNNANSVESTSGTVTVVKVGNSYSFLFSNGIPDLKDVTMQKGENNTIFFNSDAIGSITISESSLSIDYLDVTKKVSWHANCKR